MSIGVDGLYVPFAVEAFTGLTHSISKAVLHGRGKTEHRDLPVWVHQLRSIFLQNLCQHDLSFHPEHLFASQYQWRAEHIQQEGEDERDVCHVR
jgi:hypothetical protein